MKERKPKDLADKPDKPLRLRYKEVVRLREIVREIEAQGADTPPVSKKRW